MQSNCWSGCQKAWRAAAFHFTTYFHDSIGLPTLCLHTHTMYIVCHAGCKHMTLWGWWLSESPFKVVSSNRERNSGPTDLSLIVFYKTWFYSLYLTSMGRVLAVKMCFKLNPELSLLFFPFLFMAPKRKGIVGFQWWCGMFTLNWCFKKKTKVSLKFVFTPREQGMYP